MDQVFEGAPVPPWLRRFEQEPVEALHDLLLGVAELGHLAVAEPEQLLLDWIEALGTTSAFPRRVDQALAAWIERSFGDPLLGPPPGSAARTALAWCRAADVIASEPKLREAASTLKERMLRERHFLGALSEGASRDPLGRAWVALARHQEDRSLVEHWWQLCHLPPDEPWYRGAHGIHGLRGLPPLPEEAHRAGGFPVEVARGLVLLGTGLAQRADERWLRPEIARDEFLRTARLTMAAYPLPEAWAAFWDDALQRPAGEFLQGWLRSLSQAAGARRGAARAWPMMDPRSEEAKLIAQQLARGGAGFEAAVTKATILLRHQQRYAEMTGNDYYFVRSSCNFAARIGKRKADLALSWLRSARRFDPWNAHTWTQEAQILLAKRRLDEALRTAWEATERFPDDEVAHNVLAEVLRAQGRLDEAEAQYRLAIERFPDDEVAYSGLAEVLRAQRRLDEAEAQYRLAIERFPDDEFAYGGLAGVLRAQGRLDEAEAQYRLAIERFPDNEVACGGLAEMLRAQGRLDEAEAQYRLAIERFPDDEVAYNGFAEFLRAQGRLDEAEAQYRLAIERFPDDKVAYNGLAEVLRARRRLDEAEAQYRLAIERFPDDEFAHGGLAGVLRAQGKLDEAEAQYRLAIERFPYNEVVHDGLPGVLRALGRHDEAEAQHSRANVPKPLKASEGATIRPTVQDELGMPLSGQDTGASASTATLPTAALRHRLTSNEVEILLTDASLLRRWARHLGVTSALTSGDLRDRARNILQRLEKTDSYDHRAAGERGLLVLAEGEVEHAVALLREAVRRFPGSARVRYALARAERQRAERERRRLDPAKPDALVVPWRQLERIAPICRPVHFLGEGRAWLAQIDGTTVEEGARKAFGELAFWLRARVQNAGVEEAHDQAPEVLRARVRPSGNDFQCWWAREVQIHLFGAAKVERAEDLSSLDEVRERLANYGPALDELEESWVRRHAPP
ncbi:MULTISPECIES: tetratricopeptide repeat protein [Sorangium]|nr:MULTISPECIES: tetratricopeptide repeat protein [Sorangium]